MNVKRGTAVGLLMAGVFVFVGASSCDSGSPGPDSDSAQSYDGGTIPIDKNVYTIRGKVSSPVDSLTRQTQPASGSLFGINGYVSGNFSGPVQSGKSFIRLEVQTAQPSTDLAPEGGLIIIKATDTKATALSAGDVVTFKCRRQYEAVAAVENGQSFDKNADATWELDFCRLASPVVGK